MISQFLLPLEISHWITAHIQPEATAWVTQSFNNCLHGKHTPTNELWEAWVNGLMMKEILQNWFTKANRVIITSKRPVTNDGNHQKILRANYPRDRLSDGCSVEEGCCSENLDRPAPHAHSAARLWSLCTGNWRKREPLPLVYNTREGGGCLSIH